MQMTHDDIGPAIGRLVAVAKGDTHQSARTANFLLAWWNGDDWGHFPIADLFGLDREIAAAVAAIVAYLARHPGAIYPDAWGYRDAMADLVEQWRPEPDADKPRTVGDLDLSVRIINLLDPASPIGLIDEILGDERHPLRAKLGFRGLRDLAALRAEQA